jgi:hypothetical protein
MSFSPALRIDFSIFKRSNIPSYRPFDMAQDKLQPVSIFVFGSPAKKTWIPACAGKTVKSRLLVDELGHVGLGAGSHSVCIIVFDAPHKVCCA